MERMAMGIEPNNEFFSEKPAEKPVEKPIPKMVVTNKGKAAKKTITKAVVTKSDAPVKQKEKEKEVRPVVSQEQYDLEKAKYPQYFALSDYHKKCLIATNYWRVLNGMPIIEVPPQYTYYHKYFDNRCYELAKNYQIKRDRILAQRKVTGEPTDEDKVVSLLVKVERNEMYAKDAVVEINKLNGIEPVVPEESEVTEIPKVTEVTKTNEGVGGFEVESDVTPKQIKVSKKVEKEKKEAEIFNEAVKKPPIKKVVTKIVEKVTEVVEPKKEEVKAEVKKEDNSNEPQLSLF